MGSNAKVSAMPEQIKNMFVRVFSRIPQRVFWKWEVDNLAVNTLPASVKIVNWLPQQDLLGMSQFQPTIYDLLIIYFS